MEVVIVIFFLFFAVLAFGWFYLQRAKARDAAAGGEAVTATAAAAPAPSAPQAASDAPAAPVAPAAPAATEPDTANATRSDEPAS